MMSAWVSADPISLRLIPHIRRAAASRSCLLICGEPGVGRDLAASLVHYLGPNADGPLVRIDCAAMPGNMLEDELFGSEVLVGAGVVHVRHGRLEMNAPGTVVLQEVAALSMGLQARLLRAIERGRFERTGGVSQIPLNARIVALTTADLQRAIARRSFREDLYFRLAVSQLLVPPLRERRRDIVPLAEHFVRQLCQLHRKPLIALPPDVAAVLEHYCWPGNVRELRHLIEMLVLAANSTEVALSDIPAYIRRGLPGADGHKMSLEQMERAYIIEVLQHTRGRKSAAAGILGISRKTLLEKRKRYGLQ